MNITFREYEEKDKDLLFELTKKLSAYVKSTDHLQRIQNHPGFAEHSFEQTLEKVAKYQGKIWFAEDGGEVVGYVIGVIWEQSEENKLEIGEHKLGEIIDVFVEDNYRGKRIGTQMLQMMEDYFKEKGCDSVWIMVFANNQGAHKLYKKYGFIDREVGMLKQI